MDPKALLAAQSNLGQIGGNIGFGPWGNLGAGGSGVSDSAEAFNKIITNTIGVMTIIAGIWFLFQFIIGGYGYMTAGGDPKKISDATAKITSGLIGLVIVVAAYALISLIGQLLGYDILNPHVILNILKP